MMINDYVKNKDEFNYEDDLKTEDKLKMKTTSK